MCRVPKAVANSTRIGGLTTLEDETSVEELAKSHQELEVRIFSMCSWKGWLRRRQAASQWQTQ